MTAVEFHPPADIPLVEGERFYVTEPREFFRSATAQTLGALKQ
jgi:hypothetical protein